MKPAVLVIDQTTKAWQRVFTLAGALICIGAFAMRLSMSVGSIALPLAAVLILCSPLYKQVGHNLRHHPVAIAAGLFLLAYIIGLFYSPVPWHARLNVFKHFLPLLMFSVWMSLFQQRSVWCKRVMLAIVWGTFFYFIVDALNYYHVLSISQWTHEKASGHPHPRYIFGRAPLLFSLGIFICAQLAIHDKRRRLLYGVLAVLMFLFICAVSRVRSDYVLLMVMSVLLITQYVSRNWLAGSLLVVLFLFVLAYFLSPHIHAGFNRMYQSFVDYYHGNPNTSSGLRVLFLTNSLHLWVHRPFFGYGTGSFYQIYLTMHSLSANGALVTMKNILDQPHNQYAYTLIELGVFGWVFLVGFLSCAFTMSFKLPVLYRNIAQGAVIGFAVNSMFASCLFYHVSCNAFLLILALCFSQYSMSDRLIKTVY